MLGDFLANTTGHGEHMTGEELAPRWQPTPDRRGSIDVCKKEIDRHLAHLNRARVLKGKPAWRYPAIVRQIVDGVRDYHRHMVATGAPDADILDQGLRRIDEVASVEFVTTRHHGERSLTTTSTTPIVVSSSKDPLRVVE